MTTQYNLTNNDSVSTQSTAWRIFPFNMPSVDIAPPPIRKNLHVFMNEDLEHFGGFDLSWEARIKTIDPELHNQLLAQSLQEYDDIWVRLAQR